ncbi:MAG: hypothetical protein AAGI54_03765 [Planctomycetota bacterium]
MDDYIKSGNYCYRIKDASAKPESAIQGAEKIEAAQSVDGCEDCSASCDIDESTMVTVEWASNNGEFTESGAGCGSGATLPSGYLHRAIGMKATYVFHSENQVQMVFKSTSLVVREKWLPVICPDYEEAPITETINNPQNTIRWIKSQEKWQTDHLGGSYRDFQVSDGASYYSEPSPNTPCTHGDCNTIETITLMGCEGEVSGQSHFKYGVDDNGSCAIVSLTTCEKIRVTIS